MSLDFDLDDLVMTTALADIHDAKILIVDDNRSNVALLEAILEEEEYERVFSTTDPFQVEPLFQKHQFDLILLDIRMPGMSGIEVLQRLATLVGDDYLPVIVLTAQTDQETRQQALAAGAKDFITKPFDDWEVLLRIKNTLQTRLYFTRQVLRADLMEREVLIRTKELRETQFEIVQRLGVAGELRDNETGAHVQRMSRICALLAEKRGLGKAYAELLLNASVMHDIGKIGIPDSILLKTGKLSDAEWQVMKEHPKIGGRIIGDHQTNLITIARETALYHHEKWDGTGYPDKLKGNEIPIGARILSVADTYDALVSDRVYRKGCSKEDAVKEILRCSGTQFDPMVVEAFSKVVQSERNFLKREQYDYYIDDDIFEVL